MTEIEYQGFLAFRAGSMPVQSGQQQASTFNYRKFYQPGAYRNSDLRRIVTMIVENGYIRRVK